ncbi:MAG TPA: hypothetical protein PKI11_09405 [Candidatus Hydrogenedentes bacterium]|nr:hypothetical protein [Candidatus Hydrogenedentota bacterium]HNT86484.1 hypothetical protein [Candidatus Hydrogenedentota bacterium]
MSSDGMTAWSWAYMLAVWGAIILLNVYCFYRIFTKKRSRPK